MAIVTISQPSFMAAYIEASACRQQVAPSNSWRNPRGRAGDVPDAASLASNSRRSAGRHSIAYAAVARRAAGEACLLPADTGGRPLQLQP